ncbi:hypothetical protein ACVWQR_07775 [Neisseria meningitidis]
MPSEHSFRRHFAFERQNGGAGAVFFQRLGDICYNRLLFLGCLNHDCIEIRFYRANLFPKYACLYFYGVYLGAAAVLSD